MELHRGLDSLTDGAGEGSLVQSPRERLPGEPDEEQHSAGQKSAQD